MIRKEFKTLLMATGIGFFFGLLTVGFLNIHWPEPALAQNFKAVKPTQLPAQAGGVQDFTHIKADVAEINSIVLKKSLEFYNGSGKLITRLDMKDGLPAFTLFEPRDGLPRLKICLEDMATTSYPFISLYDKKGKEKTRLWVTNTDEGSIAILGPAQEQRRFEVSCDPNYGTRLFLGFETDKWSLLESQTNTSQLIVKSGKWENTYGVAMKK